MTRRPAAICLALATLAPASAAAQKLPEPSVRGALLPSVRSAVTEADSLFFAMDPVAAMRRLEVRLEVAPDDFEARWRAARAALVIGVMVHDETKSGWLRAAARHAELALSERPDDVEAMAWVAATKGRVALDDAGAHEMSQIGEEVWSLTKRILELDPQHPLGNDVHGKLHQEVRSLSGFERFIARHILGAPTLMSEASWEQSEEHLRRAIAADSTVVLFYLDLGETYMLQGKDEDARRVFEEGLRVPDLYPTDPEFKATMRRRLEELKSR